ncbi:hypothetical protein D4764_02G0008750 [Takifugu flavidus]|uniref:Uncharacterized protein n=1 Tax=Takifugu flavidus TaxID=433684 RepID=A0A5C6NKC0_9TELE|nr:hypothetical protein D4764_02G0008750 [Takifugu flavidus]
MQVKRYKLDKVLTKGTVEQIIPVLDGKHDKVMGQRDEDEAMTVTESISERSKKKVDYFLVQLQEGIILKARQVVLATGPTRAQMANIPSWVKSIGESFPEERLRHTVELMHHRPAAGHVAAASACEQQKDVEESCVVCEGGQRVMVVGGGLTSAHVVSIALKQGASHVTWLMRKHLQLKQFDVGDVETLVGRYSHVEHGIKMDGQAYLRQFYNERSLHKRLAMIHQARKGGAVTPEAYIHLQPYIQRGQVDVKTYCQVRETSWCYSSQAWSVALSNGERWNGDTIWLATGCKLDVKQDPLLFGVIKEFPIQIGPHAVNLAGGQAASMRITTDITRRLQQDLLKVSQPSGEKSKTEEYIQQMKGLLWL